MGSDGFEKVLIGTRGARETFLRYVEDMAWMFMGSLSFNQPLNNWDVSNVTNMWYMFLDATSFNQPLNKYVLRMSWPTREALVGRRYFITIACSPRAIRCGRFDPVKRI